MPLINSQKFSEISFTVYLNVKTVKFEILNLIYLHQSLGSGDVNVKQVQHFPSCLRKLSNHVTYVTKFKPEFQE